MPRTLYLHAHGRKIAQVKDGVRTDYLTDALGSITATKNQSQQIVNTYRWKPYGGQLAKTGTGEDPKYGWREFRLFSDQTLSTAALTYMPEFGFVFSVAANVSLGDGTFYGGAVMLRAPVCGGQGAPWHKLKPQKVGIKASKTFHAAQKCATTRFVTEWELLPGTAKSSVGSIIQQMQVEIMFRPCTKSKYECGCTDVLRYLEAWPVSNGQPEYADDTFGWAGCADEKCLRGNATWVGNVGYYDGCTSKSSPWTKGGHSGVCVEPWGGLYYVNRVPGGFKAGPCSKKLSYASDCCVEREGFKSTASFSGGGTPYSSPRGNGWSGNIRKDCKPQEACA